MNINPDSIDKYKQQMLNMYRSSPTRATSSTTSNMATARSLASNVPQPGTSTAPVNNAAAASAARSVSTAPAASTASIAPAAVSIPQASSLPVPDEATPGIIEDAIALNERIAAHEHELFDPSLEAEERDFVPTYVAPYVPDVGNIAAPNFPGIPDTGEIGVPDFSGVQDTGPAEPLPTTPSPPKPNPPKPNPPKPNPPKPNPPNNPPKPNPPANPPSTGVQVPDTGYIEIPKYPGIPDTQPASPLPETKEGVGYLRTQAYTGNRAIPVTGALILITEHIGDKINLVRILVTDESGYTETVPLAVPEVDENLYPDPATCPYRDYRISAFAEGFYIIQDVPVPIYAGVKSLQPIALVPLRENEERINYLAKPIEEILEEVGVDGSQAQSPETPSAPASPGTPDVGNIAAPGTPAPNIPGNVG